jgi:Na+/H+ antiporter NhaD/arsenite permease-like protein
MIAFEANLSFEDFLIWALPTGLVVLGATLLITMKLFASDIRKMDGAMKLETIKRSSVYSELLAHPGMRVPMVIFVGTMIGLVIHRPIEDLFHLQRNTMLLAVPLIAAAVSLIYGHKETIDVVEKRVQWSTLVFFIFFFGVTGALEYSGVTDIMASKITSLTGGNMILMIVVFLWFTGILSAFMDNVLAVATITPILAVMGSAFPLWWAVLFGACFMGNLTIIGSSANIVATTYYEKNTGKSIGFYEWLKPGIIVALSQMAIATLMTIALHVYLFP